MKELPKFGGRPLVENPDIPMIGCLEGGFGKKFLEIYNDIVDVTFNGNEALKVLNFSDNVVTGSSTYASIISNGILKQNGLNLARPVDVEYARKLCKSNPSVGLDTSGHYVDYGVVFRSINKPNEYDAKTLEPQIKKVLGVKKIKNPVVILSEDLNIMNDDNTENGLGLSLRDGAKPFVVPALKVDANFSKTDKNGMPRPDKNGSRISYTNNSGLSGLLLDGDLDVFSLWYSLAGSSSVGRVVAVKK